LNIPSRYEPSGVEEKWIRFWEEKRTFVAKADSKKPKYTIVLPPPNVTGILTLGHVLNMTIQDALIRFKKMQGYEVLWLPGTDHAGIATSNKVEEKLGKEGKTRFDIGREKFLEEAWKWKEEYHKRITSQMKRLGLSVDWTRERFTMDEAYSKAVKEAFVRLYEKGYIYRGEYIVNYCPRCGTVISNEEVEFREEEGNLWYIRYPLKDGGHLVVATTRPETMLGDTGIAVNPEDERYREFVGKTVILPLVNREIPVIADPHVDMEFGTGVVKITPAHDPDDFRIGKEHGLPLVVVIDDKGYINENGGIYAGLERYEARKRIVEDLKTLDLIERIEKHIHSVGHCSRCGTTIEPYVSKQWFVKMEDMARRARKVVEEEKVNFYLPRWKKVYYHWLDNIVDWVISRQLWWGHRIPVYYCSDCGEVMVSREEVKKCAKCDSENITQEEDVLDTWFSSWLWPFATLGWPEETEDFEAFFPTDTLVTGWDIIFLWVARMIMASLEFTNDIPFRDVYFNGMVRDEKRRKLSKSLGNSPDPMDLIKKYGSDALRLGMMLITPEGQDVIYTEKSIEIGRNFLNKLWNSFRFIDMNRTDVEPSIEDIYLTRIDRWIISRTMKTIREVENHLNNFRVNDAVRLIYDRYWFEFCDWYLEMIKPSIGKGEKERERSMKVALWVMSQFLKMLNPFIPCIAEEIYHLLFDIERSLSEEEWPVYEKTLEDEDVENEVSFVMEFVENVRNVRGEFKIHPSVDLTVFLDGDEGRMKLLEEEMPWIVHLTRVKKLERGTKRSESAFFCLKGLDVYVPLEGLIDVDKERERLRKEYDKLVKEIEKLETRLSNEDFLKKAPEKVVNGAKEKLKYFREKAEKINEILRHLG